MKRLLAAAVATAAIAGGVVLATTNDPPALVFEDRFDGTALNKDRWTVLRAETSGAKPDKACWDDYPETIKVSRGTLKLKVVKTREPFLCKSRHGDFQSRYKGASIATLGTHEFTYGKVTVRAKMPTAKVPGIHSAIWLYPVAHTYGRWPLSGEIDIGEFYSRYPDRLIPVIHYASENLRDPTKTNNYCKIERPTTFHDYTVEWTPEKITVTYDDKVCIEHKIDARAPLTGSAPFDRPFMLALTQTLGIGQNPFTEGTTPLPQTLEITRVRIWEHQ